MPKTKQTGNARYTVHLPTHDPHGNLLHDLSVVGHQWLNESIPRLLHSVHTEGPHPSHPYRHLKIVAVDTPETDSHVKQLAVHAGEISNHPHISVLKEGQQGMHPWNLVNRMHDGGPAHPNAIQFQAPPQQF